MNELQLQGTVVDVLKEESGVSKAGKDWKKQDFILNTGGEYSKDICITMFNDKIVSMNVGDTVRTRISIESKEWNGRYFTNVNGFNVTVVSGSSKDDTPGPPSDFPDAPETGDLPF